MCALSRRLVFTIELVFLMGINEARRPRVTSFGMKLHHKVEILQAIIQYMMKK